jgi:four helix bundle protein
MTQQFRHEQLHVYTRAVEFAHVASNLIESWPSRFAVCQQFDRATESILVNLAKSVQHQRTAAGIYELECSLGSVLECAACLDIAVLRQLMAESEVDEPKQQLQEIARMEVGLRRSWLGDMSLAEDEAAYVSTPKRYFNHESLTTYQRCLQVNEILSPIFAGEQPLGRIAKRLDESSTSLALNIAEGNGRFSQREHAKFIEISVDSGVKLAAYLDLGAPHWPEIEAAKPALRETMALLTALKGSDFGGVG